MSEELGSALDLTKTSSTVSRPTRWLEPPWKLVMANKAILPFLWSMYPNHPNLLPAFWSVQEAENYEMKERVHVVEG